MAKPTLYNGKSVSEWSKETGIKASTISYRLRNGWNIEDAVTTATLKPNECARKYDVIGKTFKDRFGNEYIVEDIDHRDQYSVTYYRIKFIKSGYETVACSSQIRGVNNSHVFDRLSPSVFGVGIMGFAHAKDNEKLFEVWRSMIARCYNPKNPSYKTYGAVGVFVCDRWKRFDLFLEDVKMLDGYDEAQIQAGELCLDKDIIDRKKMCYSPSTCCFVSRQENTRESSIRRWSKNKV